MRNFILKKDFMNCPKGSEVVVSDISTHHKFGEEPIYWFNVIDEFNSQIKLGNSITMNVEEWIEKPKAREFEIAISKDGRVELLGKQHFYLDKQLDIKEIIKVREVMNEDKGK
jgi:hypothetical protein